MGVSRETEGFGHFYRENELRKVCRSYGRWRGCYGDGGWLLEVVIGSYNFQCIFGGIFRMSRKRWREDGGGWPWSWGIRERIRKRGKLIGEAKWLAS